MYGGSRENWCNDDIHASENESGYVHACVYVKDNYLSKWNWTGFSNRRLEESYS